VCGLHCAQRDEEREFLGLASKSRSTVSPGLASKLVASGFSVWASKPTAMVWGFRPQNHYDGFLVWASKSSGLRFISCATKLMKDEDGVGHTSRSNDLFRLEASWTTVSRSGFKTSRGTVWMVHVASSRGLCGVQAKDVWVDGMGCIRPFYNNFTIFTVLGPRGISVFWLGL
jgi:hypothetical protein